jgi:hypothetical protein
MEEISAEEQWRKSTLAERGRPSYIEKDCLKKPELLQNR